MSSAHLTLHFHTFVLYPSFFAIAYACVLLCMLNCPFGCNDVSTVFSVRHYTGKFALYYYFCLTRIST